VARHKPAETPLMRQFLDVAEAYPDAIVFFRCGDFYEMFFESAVQAARLLDLTLTSRDKGKEDAVPMCGVPHHAARGYVARLTELGHKVVIVDQVEDPRLAKGLVKREVVRVVTPGVMLDDEVLEPKTARYLAAVVPPPRDAAPPAEAADAADTSRRKGKKATAAPAAAAGWGLAYLDVTTGEFHATELASIEALADELARAQPCEVLASADDLADDGAAALARRRWRVPWSPVELPALADASAALEAAVAPGDALAGKPMATRAAAAVLAYARATQPAGALPLSRIHVYEPGSAMVLDETAIANLELVQTLVGARKQGSLLAVIDETCTAPGGRLLRRWLLYPLTDVATIRRRHDAVEWLVARPHLRGELRRALDHVHDLERLAGKATLGVATPRDLARLRDSLERLPGLCAQIAGGGDALDAVPPLLDLGPVCTPALATLAGELAAALADDPPAITKEGGFIRAGFDATVDESRRLTDGGKDEILAIENRERDGSGISSLKVRYNRVFGYYIEITKSQLARVPAHYVRKQTVATGERYVTPELGELERKVLSAEETLIERENELFRALVARVAQVARAIGDAGGAVATVDAIAGLAEVAQKRGYARPEVDDSHCLEITEGRHPVVEALVPDGTFVPNDCRLDANREQILLLTGPNMAGKSTYMRQVAHIALLAQMGSFVPARAVRLGICDRVFTRVGASDNLSRGDSTFMVEMRETAAIVAGATRRSLVVLDEVGRGTSTFDGVSIAWAVTEFLHDAIGARTLFATHYHELVALAETRPRVRNVSVAVREHRGEIVFLRRVVPGGASKSYGIDVARLAGLPRSVIARARQILGQLEGGATLGASPQLSLLQGIEAAPRPAAAIHEGDEGGAAALARLRELEPDRMTPLEALTVLAELRRTAGN
jgi:DNA mismatch repair protein MutS